MWIHGCKGVLCLLFFMDDKGYHHFNLDHPATFVRLLTQDEGQFPLKGKGK